MIINLNCKYISKYNPDTNFTRKNVLIKKVFLKKYIHIYLILTTLFKFKKNSIFIKKLKKNWYTFLKSPNRHKKHQSHVYQQFYIIKMNLKLVRKISNVINFNLNHLEFFNFVVNLFSYESNLYSLKSIKYNIQENLNFNKINNEL